MFKKRRRYIFAPYRGMKSKGTCPSCGKKYHWVYYLDTENEKLLPPEYGKCDNISKCGYTYSPYDHPPTKTTDIKVSLPEEKDYFSVVPESILIKSLEHQYNDNFSQYILEEFGEEGERSLDAYSVGYSKVFNGATTVFWQIDVQGNIRSGKLIKYKDDGKRVKNPYPLVTWVHKSFLGEFVLSQCFFGEHLLKDDLDKTVCVVESEKTAIICDILKPGYIWIAATQLQGLNLDKLKVLNGRNVVFYPDKGEAYKLWKEKLKDLEKNLDFKYKVSRFVENSKELKEGDDLADLLLNQIEH